MRCIAVTKTFFLVWEIEKRVKCTSFARVSLGEKDDCRRHLKSKSHLDLKKLKMTQKSLFSFCKSAGLDRTRAVTKSDINIEFIVVKCFNFCWEKCLINTKLLIRWLVNHWQQYKTTDKLTGEPLTTIQNYWYVDWWTTDNNTKLLISWLVNYWQQYKTTDKLTGELLTTIQNYW